MTDPARQVTYLPGLDGLRAIAVLLVLWAHVNPLLPGYPAWLLQLRFLHDPGIQGVDLFFVLSGFLITRILLDERRRGLPLRWFLMRRLLRIFPIYYLLLAIVWVARGGAELPWCAVYLSNFYFVSHGGGGPLEHTWSLCIEEHFYLLWPPVVAFLPRRTALRVLGFLVLPAAILTATVVALSVAPEQLYHCLHYVSPIRFLSLGSGCLMAFAEPALLAHRGRTRGLGVGLLLLGAASSSSALIALPLALGHAPLLDPRCWALPNLFSAWLLSCGTVLCCLAAGRVSVFAALRLPPLRAIGRVSYGLYLYHWPIFQWMRREPTTTVALACIGLSFAAATISYWLIERPILRFGARFR